MTPDSILRRYNNISDAEIKKTGQLIIEVETQGINPVSFGKMPKVFILGGQPGAGKTELIGIVQQEMAGDVVICNADNFRQYHPRHAEIAKNEPAEFYPDITAPYAMLWNKMLRDYCEANRLNYVLETTFSSGSRMNDTISEVRNKGCEVNIKILAVHSDISFLYTLSRYEDMLAVSHYGRVVGKHAHDERYNAIAATLSLVQEANLYHHIAIYGRPGIRAMRDGKNGLIEVSKDGKTPLKDYLREREKEWSVTDKKYFMQEALSVVEKMVRRKAQHENIQVLFDNYSFASY
jgi:predicted ABC-type ATPase